MRFPSRTALLLLSSVALAVPATADEIFLRGGGRVSGVIVQRTTEAITVETPPGLLTLSMKRVERIVEGRSAVEEFQDRAARLAPGDVNGWVALAHWAADHDLVTHSREAWHRVLAADPAHPEANAALGRVQLGGEWMSESEAYRARGYVEYEGRWVTPAEHEALLQQDAAEQAALLQNREAELRVREAEARAREAEARAREAEAAGSTSDEGIPLWWGWGGGVPLYPPFVDRSPHEGGPSGGSHHPGHPGQGPPTHHPHPGSESPNPSPGTPSGSTAAIRVPANAPATGTPSPTRVAPPSGSGQADRSDRSRQD
jgi:hypothetical protein